VGKLMLHGVRQVHEHVRVQRNVCVGVEVADTYREVPSAFQGDPCVFPSSMCSCGGRRRSSRRRGRVEFTFVSRKLVSGFQPPEDGLQGQLVGAATDVPQRVAGTANVPSKLRRRSWRLPRALQCCGYLCYCLSSSSFLLLLCGKPSFKPGSKPGGKPSGNSRTTACRWDPTKCVQRTKPRSAELKGLRYSRWRK